LQPAEVLRFQMRNPNLRKAHRSRLDLGKAAVSVFISAVHASVSAIILYTLTTNIFETPIVEGNRIDQNLQVSSSRCFVSSISYPVIRVVCNILEHT
jgi:hypothetical protein